MPSTPIFNEVSSAFLRDLARGERPLDPAKATIVRIEKVNNFEIRKQYDLKLELMAKRERKRRKEGKEALDEAALEKKWVYHACAAESVTNIIEGGFNRSYAGKNAVFYVVIRPHTSC